MSRYRLSAVLALFALALAFLPNVVLAETPPGDVSAARVAGTPAAEPCEVGGPYTDKLNVSAEPGSISIAGGTLSWNDPKGTVSWDLDEGVTLALCVFGGTDRLEFASLTGSGTSQPPLRNPAGQTADVSNFAWGVVTQPEPGTGTLVLAKVVVGAEPEGTTYGFEAACGNAEPYTITLSAGEQETVSTELVDGTACTVTETDNGGADTTSGTVRVDDGEPQPFAGALTTVTIAEDTTTTVTFINTFDDEPEQVGFVSVEKVVDGPAGDTSFVVDIDCGAVDLGAFASLSFGAEGGTTDVDVAIPAGVECTVTESDTGGAASTYVAVDPEDDASLGAEGVSAAVTITADATRVVRFTNAFDETVVEGPGFLTVEKVVSGDGGPAAGASFVVEVDCGEFGLGDFEELSFGADGGTVEVGVGIPDGTECTVTETEAAGADATYVVVDPDADEDRGAAGRSARVTITEDATTRVRFTNAFSTGTPGPRPSPTPTPGPRDGADDTEVLGATVTPTRIDAGAGGAALPSLPLHLIVSLLLAVAAVTLALSGWRQQRHA